MPVPLTALFAAALHQVKASDADPAGNARVLALLTRAAANTRVVFELDGDRLLVNGLPVGGEAPGALLVRTALIEHDTSRLELPATMGTAEWREVAALFASPPGLFPTATEIRDALLASVQGADLLPFGRPAMSDELRAALFDLPAESTAARRNDANPSLVSREAERADFSRQLDPILEEGARAVDREDWEQLCDVLVRLRTLEAESGEAYRAIIARERRRIAPPHVVDSLVRLLMRPSRSPAVQGALESLGADGAGAVIEALNGAPGRTERRAYVLALATMRDADAAILTALGSHRPQLVADVAEAAAKRGMTRAVPVLATLLRHANQDVRTAAYRALEEIASPEALEALTRR